MTREEWLETAVDLLRPWYDTHGYSVPERVRVSVGWPRGSRKAVGQCWYKSCTSDNVPQVFISPVQVEPLAVLSTLAHELVHAAIDPHSGHAGKFVTAMHAIGLTGKPTCAGSGPLMAELMIGIALKLGDYPHAKLNPSDGFKKQSTRLLKVECDACGYVARVTRKWLESGCPLCPCNESPMREV